MADTQSRRLEERLAYEALLIVALTGLALVQVTLVPAPLGFPPALLLVLVICRVLVGSRSWQPDASVAGALRWGFYGGLALDLCTATPIGTHALAIVLAATLVAAITRRMRVEGPFLPLLAVMIGALVYELVLAAIYIWTVAPIDWPHYASWVILPSVLMALIPTLPMFLLLRWLAMQRSQ